MADMATALRSVRRLAFARSPAEWDAARLEAAALFDSAGWDVSARSIRESIKPGDGPPTQA